MALLWPGGLAPNVAPQQGAQAPPAAPVGIPRLPTPAVTDATVLRAQLNQISPPFARAMHLASSLGADPKLFRPTPARATSATWSMVRSASLPNLDEIGSEGEDDQTEVRRRR